MKIERYKQRSSFRQQQFQEGPQMLLPTQKLSAISQNDWNNYINIDTLNSSRTKSLALNCFRHENRVIILAPLPVSHSPCCVWRLSLEFKFSIHQYSTLPWPNYFGSLETPSAQGRLADSRYLLRSRSRLIIIIVTIMAASLNTYNQSTWPGTYQHHHTYQHHIIQASLNTYILHVKRCHNVDLRDKTMTLQARLQYLPR